MLLIATIYVDAAARDADALGRTLDVIADQLKAASVVGHRTQLECDVHRNPDRPLGREWLDAETIIDVYTSPKTPQDSNIAWLVAVLEELDRRNYRYVTASDLEDRLPSRGSRW